MVKDLCVLWTRNHPQQKILTFLNTRLILKLLGEYFTKLRITGCRLLNVFVGGSGGSEPFFFVLQYPSS